MPPSAWTPLTNLAPGAPVRFALLSDGSMIQPGNGYRLTPDATGSYINGTWTTGPGFVISARHNASLLLLPDGRLMVFGGVAGDGTRLSDDPASTSPLGKSIVGPSSTTLVTMVYVPLVA